MVDVSLVKEDIKKIAKRHNIAYFEANDVFNENIDAVFHCDQTAGEMLGARETFFDERIIDLASNNTAGYYSPWDDAILIKDKQNLSIPYHELAHTLQNNMFNIYKDKYYIAYLQEMHSECFAYAALMLRAKNTIDFIRQTCFAYRRGLDMTTIAFFSDEAKLYASLPVMKETIKQIWKNHKNKAAFFRKDGSLNEDYLSQFALGIVKRSAYSEEWFNNFYKKHRDRYKKYKFLLTKQRIIGEEVIAAIFLPIFETPLGMWKFKRRTKKLVKSNNELLQKIDKLLKRASNDFPERFSYNYLRYHYLVYDYTEYTPQDRNLITILTTSPEDKKCKEYHALRKADTKEKLEKLLKDNIDINSRDVLGYTALMDAENINKTVLLVDNGADIHAKTKTGVTALMTAKTAQQTDFLLKAGADVNAQDDFGYTALMLANTAEQAKTLLDAGADINKKNYRGENAFEFIKENERISKRQKQKILHLLETYGSPQQKKNSTNTISQTITKQFRNISYTYHIYKLRYQQKIKAGMIALAVTASGAFGVHQKAEYDHEQKVIELKETIGSHLFFGYALSNSYGYFEFDKIVDDVNAQNQEGFTPLTLCSLYDENQTAKKLIELGADVNVKNKDGSTALIHAQTPKMARLLLEAGADVNVKDEDGVTALMRAKTPEIARLLLEAGADVNAADNFGRTALDYHCPSMYNYTNQKNIRELIEHNKKQYKTAYDSLKRVKQKFEKENDTSTPEITPNSSLHSSENERTTNHGMIKYPSRLR